jgi:hypothetical protein
MSSILEKLTAATLALATIVVVSTALAAAIPPPDAPIAVSCEK